MSEQPRDKSNTRRQAVRLAPKRRCAAATKAGAPCPATPLLKPDPDGITRCHQHSTDPLVVAKREADRSRAGFTTALRRVPPDVVVDFDSRDGVRTTLKTTAENVIAGRITPSQATALNALCGMVLKLDEIELGLRLAAIEEQLATSSKPSPIIVKREG